MSRVLGKVAGKSRHSTMYLWMQRHRAQFAAELKEAQRPDWSYVAGLLADEGLRDANGNEPSASSAQHTWFRVKAANREQPLSVAARAVIAEPVAVNGDAAAQLARVQETMKKRSAR